MFRTSSARRSVYLTRPICLELTLYPQIEIDIHVDLSARQRAMYKSLLANVSVADLLEKAASADANTTRTLMNLVMQFRKVRILAPPSKTSLTKIVFQVCNHPELFERAYVKAPLSFVQYGKSGPLNRDPDPLPVSYSTRNPIEVSIPTLLYTDGGLLDVPAENSRPKADSGILRNLMNIWSTDWIRKSYFEDGKFIRAAMVW